MVAIVHDEVVIEVVEEDVEDAKDILKFCMINGMKKIIKDIPVIVDISINDNWCK